MDSPFQGKRFAFITLLGLFSFIALGCGFGQPPSLQQEVRKFFYENQTDSGKLFVDWAEKNLGNYSDRTIQDALHEEGKYHAELGHPNAISVISFAARDWAEKNGLGYNELEWRSLQKEALENIRTEPGELIFWPK